MTSEINHLLTELQNSGWIVKFNETSRNIPDAIVSRYSWASKDIFDVISKLQEVISVDETIWLLTVDDYTGKSESAFAWNEWEIQSLDAAQGDPEWIEKIKSFWDNHLPLALSTKDGYAYYALTKNGQIAFGREPEFEETTLVANSYAQLLQNFTQ